MFRIIAPIVGIAAVVLFCLYLLPIMVRSGKVTARELFEEDNNDTTPPAAGASVSAQKNVVENETVTPIRPIKVVEQTQESESPVEDKIA